MQSMYPDLHSELLLSMRSKTQLHTPTTYSNRGLLCCRDVRSSHEIFNQYKLESPWSVAGEWSVVISGDSHKVQKYFGGQCLLVASHRKHSEHAVYSGVTSC